MSKSLIIGCGFVGSALADVIRSKACILDPKHPSTLSSLEVALRQEPEIVFICLPTPANSDGECNPSLILDYCCTLKLKNYFGLVVIKSTIPPWAVESILHELPNVVVWPELLREAHAYDDMQNPTLTVIGANRSVDAQTLKSFIEDETVIILNQCQEMTSVEASIFKYLTNSFLATKVVFMHEAYQWMMARGMSRAGYESVMSALASEGRVGSSHLMAPGTHGLGFGGACFPKDTQALLAQAQRDGSPLDLLQAAMVINANLNNYQP